MTARRLNDDERRLWVLNDERLYNWYRAERSGLRRFIRANREAIDTAILSVLDRPPAAKTWSDYR